MDTLSFERIPYILFVIYNFIVVEFRSKFYRYFFFVGTPNKFDA